MTMQFSNQPFRAPSRVARVKNALEGVSWFTVIALWLWFGGLVGGLWGAVAHDWYSLAAGLLCEVGAAVAVLFSLREDKT